MWMWIWLKLFCITRKHVNFGAFYNILTKLNLKKFGYKMKLHMFYSFFFFWWRSYFHVQYGIWIHMVKVILYNPWNTWILVPSITVWLKRTWKNLVIKWNFTCFIYYLFFLWLVLVVIFSRTTLSAFWCLTSTLSRKTI